MSVSWFTSTGVSYAQALQGTVQDEVSAVLPYDMEFLHTRLSVMFNSTERSTYEDYPAAIYILPEGIKSAKELPDKAFRSFLKLPLVRPDKFYVFYGAYPHMQSTLAAITPLAAVDSQNPALMRYAALTAEARSHDFYLWSPSTPFWPSQYVLDGEMLPFRSNFIVHLQSTRDKRTRVEVIEHQPEIRLNHSLSVDARGGLKPYRIMPVAPTTQNRTFLLSCITQFLERNLPTRRQFNCRSATSEESRSK